MPKIECHIRIPILILINFRGSEIEVILTAVDLKNKSQDETELIRVLFVSRTFHWGGPSLMQKLSNPDIDQSEQSGTDSSYKGNQYRSKIQIIHRCGQNSFQAAPSHKRSSFFDLFSSARAGIHRRTSTTVLKESPLKNFRFHVPRANLAAIESWVGLEEKIVHDYTERKTTPSKTAIPPRVPNVFQKVNPTASVPLAPKKEPAPFRFFTSLRYSKVFQHPARPLGKTEPSVAKEPLRKSSYPHTPQAKLAEIKNWVGLEEKIIHDYAEKKTVSSGRTVSLPKIPPKQSPAAFETFSTQTTISLPNASKTEEPLRSTITKKSFKFPERALLLPGWLLASVFIFLFVQEVPRVREVSLQLAEVQSKKTWLEQSYADLKKVSVEKSAEIQWLNSQLRDMAAELRTAQGQRDAYKLDLTRIAARYESQINVLREDVRTRDAVVSVLKAQIQAFEGILDRGGIAAVPGAASQVFQPSSTITPAYSAHGKVTTVNGRQGFFVIDMGAEQGVRSGSAVAVSRGSTGVTVGRIDRVYPTMSAVIVPDNRVLSNIFEGDTVSFT